MWFVFALFTRITFWRENEILIAKTRLKARHIVCIPSIFEVSIPKLAKSTGSHKCPRRGTTPPPLPRLDYHCCAAHPSLYKKGACNVPVQTKYLLFKVYFNINCARSPKSLGIYYHINEVSLLFWCPLRSWMTGA